MNFDTFLDMLTQGVLAVAWFCFLVVVARNGASFLQLIVAAYHFYIRVKPGQSSSELWQRYSDLSLPISVIAPAYNEELTIVESVSALLALEYPNHEVIVVNDGSSDDTLGRLQRGFDLEKSDRLQVAKLEKTKILGTYRSRRFPNLFVVDKENGRKADATNAGIGFARTPLVCVIDADSIIEPDGLLRAAEPFMHDDGRLVAVGGTIRVVNDCEIEGGSLRTIRAPRKWIPRFQVVEYLRAFLTARVASASTGTLILISGAFGLFRRSTLVEIGGYRHDTVGEDLELLVRIHRHMREQGREYSVDFVPDIVCWTEVPECLEGLGNQRSRWQQGALETLTSHKAMIFNPKFGRIGLVALPHLVLEDILGPPAELTGYVVIPIAMLLGILDPVIALAFFSISVLFGIALSFGSLALEELQLKRAANVKDLSRIAAAAVIESFGFRQLNLYYRIKGIGRFWRKDSSWAAVPRVGFAGKPRPNEIVD